MLQHHSLSTVQENIYFEQLLYPEIPIYNIGARVDLKGDLDPEILHNALIQTFEQESILQSTIVVENDKPFWKIRSDISVNVEFHDLSEHSDADAMASAIIKKNFQQPFDLGGDDLLHVVKIYRLSRYHHCIYAKFHHLVSDGWSTSLLFSRIAKNYEHIKCGNTAEDTSRYDYWNAVSEDFSYKESDAYREDESYWTEKIKLFGQPQFFPPAKQAGTVAVNISARKVIEIDRQIYNDIISISKSWGITTFHFLIGVVYTYFYVCNDGSPFIIALPLLNRKNSVQKNTVGLFTGLSPLLLKPDVRLGFIHLVQRIRAVLREDFRHQRFPMSDITSIFRQIYGHQTGTLHQLFFSYEKHDYSLSIAGCQTVVTPLSHYSERAPAAMYVREFDETEPVRIDIDYNTAYFDEYQIDQFKQAFPSLIAELVSGPERPIGEISILTEAERWRIREEYNGTLEPGYCGRGLCGLLEAGWADRIREAIRYRDVRVSYGELEAISGQIACMLRERYGVGGGDVVGLLVDRSEWMVLGMVGILRSGAGYVPVDPDHPGDRKSYIIRHSGVRVVLTQSSYLSWLLSEGYEGVVLSGEELSGYGGEVREGVGGGEDLAYVMYTSGSTGRPKGVEVLQRGVANFLLSMRSLLGVKGGDRVLAVTTYSFDISVLELLLPLISGATVIVVDKVQLQQGGELNRILERERPTVMQCTPAFWQLILDGGWRGDRAVRALCGGDKLSPELSGRILEVVGTLWNVYGPTETTIWSSAHRIVSAKEASNIGRPLANTQLYIMNSGGQELPAGIAGELCIGGEGLARGYRGQAELTAERFREEGDRGRVYHTGDMARRLSDGSIEFLGRLDNQIKIRGYRVEAGEIESVLLEEEGIREAVVLKREEHLAAYIVTEGVMDEERLRRQLRRRLPEYMLPSYFIGIGAMPLSANGKIDRKALLEIGGDERRSSGYRAAETSTEALLTGIWEEVLGQVPIGTGDDFFEMGGHSLRGVQVLSRVRQELGVELGLQELFSHPTIGELSALLEGRGVSAAGGGIERAEEAEYYELSSGQRRLWIMSQFGQGSLAYNVAGAYRVRGLLDREGLEWSLRAVISRHESLRTVFRVREGVPMQKVLLPEEVGFTLAYKDIRGSGAEEEAQREAKRELEERFVLGEGPLLRAKLLRVGEEEHVLLLTVHHIITDAWSMEVMARELGMWYDAYGRGERKVVPGPGLQYRDYAGWQNRRLRNGEMDQHRDYWLELLRPPLPVIQLPADLPRPEIQTFQGDLITVTINETLTERVYTFSRRQKVTPFMFLLAVSKILLNKYTGETDIITGVPMAAREHSSLAEVVGFFVNMVPIRTKMEVEGPIARLLETVRTGLQHGHTHQAFPFDALVDALNLQRDISRSPLFDIVIAQDKELFEEIAVPGFGSLRFERFSSQHTNSKYELTLSFTIKDRAIAISAEYNTALYEKMTIQRMLDRFIHLTGQLMDNPEIAIKDISMLTEAERWRIREEYNGTLEPGYCGRGLCGLLEAGWADRIREAIRYRDVRVSYGELEAISGQIACMLRERYGVGRGDVVGLLVDRSEWMVLGMVGILRSGAGYVPVDPDHPGDRKSYIIRHSGVRVVLTQSSYLSWLLSEGYEGVVLSGEELSGYGGEVREGVGGGEDLAYVMYTSGSTGRPKGVEVLQRGVANFLLSMRSLLGVKGGDRVLAVTTYSFDISVLELLLPLISGATVIVVDKVQLQQGGELNRILERERPTVMQCTPAFWQLILDGGWRGDRAVRALCGGDKLSPELSGRILEVVGTLWNVYGPTETTIWSSAHRIVSAKEASNIGRPLANTQLYIMNSGGQELPAGIAGELCIGGEGLARGYRGQAELTAERFREEGDRGRVYHTGDMARRLSDGSIEFLGRLDNQIKIRGYRVEAGEIESVLLEEEGIREAVVLKREEHLAAYIVTEGVMDEERLRRQLRRRLPEYMLPSYFIGIGAMPLSANGKIDRKALLEIGGDERRSSGYRAAETSTEALLTGIWEEVLGQVPIGTGDDFFEMGGHSLRGVQVLSRVRQELGVELGLQELFSHPTIGELSALLEGRGVSAAGGGIERAEEAEYYELSSGQRRLWIMSQFGQGSLAYNVAGAYRVRGLLDREGLEWSLRAVISRHESLRTVFRVREGVPMQKVLLPEEVGFTLAYKDIRGSGAEEEAQREAKRELEERFVLGEGPLLRAKLLRVGEEEHVLLLTVHHIITDAWSMEVMARELGMWYDAYGRGERKVVPGPGLQYRDYAGWQNRRLRNGEMDQHRDYWLELLRPPLPVIQLPADLPRPEIQTHRGGRISGALPELLFDQIQQLANRSHVTVYVVLMSLSKALLHFYTGQNDIVVVYPVAMRGRRELEDQIGFYINTLALRTKISGKDTLVKVIDKVRKGMLDGMAHQEYPFDSLVRDLSITRDPSRSPLTDVAVVLQNLDIHNHRTIQMAGMEISGYPLEDVTSTIDLRLEFIRRQGALDMNFDYNKSLFSQETIRSMMESFITLATLLLNTPNQPLEFISPDKAGQTVQNDGYQSFFNDHF